MLQTELHRHLDVSTRPATVLELAQKEGIEAQSTSLASFREKLLIREPMTDLAAVLAQFTMFQRVLARPEYIERVGQEVVEDCYAEGTRRVELRFSPSFVCKFNGLPWEEALASFERGVARGLGNCPGMQTGFLCIASREYGVEAVERTVEFYLQHQKRFIGMDLAGNEVPCRQFVQAFAKAKKAGARITIHAGEGTSPENIWEAIELLGAERIGHGVASVEDPELLKYLAKNRICLEVCPTSNLLTRVARDYASHPLPRILRAGVPVSINTDDPGIFGITLPGEFEACLGPMKLSLAELEKCKKFAYEASFLN